MKIASHIHECLEWPQLVQLDSNIIAASFGLMKMVPASFILKDAITRGRLSPSTVVVESSSGTFGYALALLCNHYKRKLILVGDNALDETLQNRLTLLGAELDIVHTPDENGNYQGKRLARVAHHRDRNTMSYWPRQYDNPKNANAYIELGEKIGKTVGDLEWIVGPVGSGGSMCGLVKGLRRVLPNIKACAVDTHGSILFGLNETPRDLRGLGNSVMPAILDHSIFDEVHWIGATEAYAATVNLYKQHALYKGPTSGAAYMVAVSHLTNTASGRILAVFPDAGNRYAATVHNPKWLDSQGIKPTQAVCTPELMDDVPQGITTGWTWLRWNRRQLAASDEKVGAF